MPWAVLNFQTILSAIWNHSRQTFGGDRKMVKERCIEQVGHNYALKRTGMNGF